VVATGAVPIDAPGQLFAPFFLATLGSQFVAMRLLARGHYPPILSVLFEILRMPAVLPATLALLWPGRSSAFKVTPKGRSASLNKRTPVPRLLSVLAAACSLGLAWFTATLLGVSPITYSVPWAAIGAGIFVAMNLALLIMAIGRIRSTRFAGNRRAGTRLPVHIPVRMAGQRGELLDLSVSGAGVSLRAPVDLDAAELWLTMDLPSGPLELQVEVRRNRMRGDSEELGLAFAPGQEQAIAKLAVAIFHAEVSTGSTGSGGRQERDGLVWEGAAA
jgi:hypothetical protein